jgi:general secretion pathway protein G
MKQKGFTLIELLVVIAIIGLLSTLAVVALNSARQRSRDAKRVADIRQVQTALELGYSETSAYPIVDSAHPITLGKDVTVLCKVGTAAVFQKDSSTPSTCGTVYMGLVPSNPTPVAASDSTNYSYASKSDGSFYTLTFSLEGTTGQLGSGVNCASPNGVQPKDASYSLGSAC